MNEPILRREQRWECPNCTMTDVTYDPRPHSQMHTCSGLKGMTTPFVPAGTKCKIEAHEREDYIGQDNVQLDADGRPIMSAITTRDDGQDCTVYAPVATIAVGS